MFKRRHFVEDAPQSPNVRLVVVWLVLPNLWAQIIRGPNAGFRVILSSLHDPRDSEIAQFHNVSPTEENVLRLDVSMQDLPVVDVNDGVYYLYKIGQNGRLRKVAPSLSIYQSEQIATLAMFHHNEDVPRKRQFTISCIIIPGA